MGAKIAVILFVVVLIPLVWKSPPGGGDNKRASTPGVVSKDERIETATVAAGCFWHVEDEFRQVEGVVATTVGYEGRKPQQPT